MNFLRKNNFIDPRVWVLAYSRTNDFINSENAGGVTLDKILQRSYGDLYDRKKFFDRYIKNELGQKRDLHLLGTNN